VNSQPNSPANRFSTSNTNSNNNNNNNSSSKLNSNRPRSLIVVKNSTIPSPSSHSPYSLLPAPQPAKISNNVVQQFQPASPQIQQTQHSVVTSNLNSTGSNYFDFDPQSNQNKLFVPTNSLFNSTSSSFTSIAKTQFKPQTTQQQQQQQLSPSPLAIADGTPILYGNSHVTQTFTPINSITNTSSAQSHEANNST
jgi:hypothetical protein